MGKPKAAIVSVINDLATDQRVERSCSLLHEMGFDVMLIGRKMRKSPPLPDRPYRMHRMCLITERGPLFYLEYNIRLFFYILFQKASLLVSNDLDTLLPNYIISRMRRIPLIYDSHEYFTGVPELEGRPVVRGIWKSIEKCIFPRLKYIITVNGSIARLFDEEYGRMPTVVRNIPRRRSHQAGRKDGNENLPSDKALIIMQGSGINMDRGAEEAVLAMQYVDNVLLLIIGGGDVIHILKEMVVENQLGEKVRFLPRMPYEELMRYTEAADIGLSLDKGSSINYRLSLPNKLFDYIQAGTAVLCSDLPEVAGIVKSYDIGCVMEGHDPLTIAHAIQAMLSDTEKMEIWKENLNIASRELCWENEKEVLRAIYAAACKS